MLEYLIACVLIFQSYMELTGTSWTLAYFVSFYLITVLLLFNLVSLLCMLCAFKTHVTAHRLLSWGVALWGEKKGRNLVWHQRDFIFHCSIWSMEKWHPICCNYQKVQTNKTSLVEPSLSSVSSFFVCVAGTLGYGKTEVSHCICRKQYISLYL